MNNHKKNNRIARHNKNSKKFGNIIARRHHLALLLDRAYKTEQRLLDSYKETKDDPSQREVNRVKWDAYMEASRISESIHRKWKYWYNKYYEFKLIGV